MDRDYDLGSRKFLVPTNRNQSDTEAQWVTQEDEDCIKCIPHCTRVSWAKKIATDGGGLMAGTHGMYVLGYVHSGPLDFESSSGNVTRIKTKGE